MHLEHLAIRTVKPGHDHCIVASCQAGQTVGVGGVDHKPRIGCAFGALTRGLTERVKRRANHPDLMKLQILAHLENSGDFVADVESRPTAPNQV